jgi:cytochrome c5
MFKQALVNTVVTTSIASLLMLSSQLMAEEDRSEVLERIKPIGTVTVEGQEAPAEPVAETAEVPAAPAPAQPAPEAPAVAATAPAPAAPAAPAAVDGQAVYQQACFACHMTGAAGAPKFGDKAAWAPRIATGKAALMTSALNGKGAMPPKGGQAQLTEDQISAAIDYMVANSQ